MSEPELKMSEPEYFRVKLYNLNEEQVWIDKGTGDISTILSDDYENQSTGLFLQIQSEVDGETMLAYQVTLDASYDRQTKEIIVLQGTWALSFQFEECCEEIWNKIEEQLNKYSEEDEGCEEIQDIGAPIELPACELSKLDEVYNIVQDALPHDVTREKLATAVELHCYVPKLIDLFHMCEDLENKESLYILFDIFKGLFMLEKNTLFEIMFLPENIMDVIGVLEHDRNKKELTPHREFLNEKVKFKEVIPISNTELSEKIHQTYRVQYIKDILVPVPSLFDDSLPTLTSFLFYNKISIVQLIQDDPHFLEELFEKLTDDEISDEQRKETIFLLRELCNFSQTLQHESRNKFIRSLADHGLLHALEQLMNIEDIEMRSGIVDIIGCVVELNPSLCRAYLCRESDSLDEDSMLLNMLIDMLLTSSNNGMGVILAQLVRSLLDPLNMDLGSNKNEKEFVGFFQEFLTFFYRNCMHVLTAPVFAATATNELAGKDDFQRAAVLDHVVDILTFCVQHHKHFIRNYIVSKDMLRRVLVLMQSTHKFLALASLRFCRKIVGLQDDLLNRYIIVGKLLQPIVQAFVNNGTRYNLLNSAIIELFQYVVQAKLKKLCSYIVENHMEPLRTVSYVSTFADIQRFYEQEEDRLERMNEESRDDVPSVGIIHNNPMRRKRDDRTLDEYEESWFESEEEEEEQLETLTENALISTETMTPILNTTATTTMTNSTTTHHDQLSGKQFTGILKDVDLLPNIPLKSSDSPPPINRPNSPNGTHKNHRPGSPQNVRKPVSPNSTHRPLSPVNNTAPRPLSPQNSPNSPKQQENLLTNKNFVNKSGTLSYVKNNNKPLIQFKINSSGISISNNYNSGKNQPSTNGITPSAVINTKTPNAELELTNHVNDIGKHENVIRKPLLTSLVDYPDDDDEVNDEDNENHEDIPSSPAKKQRIGST